MKKKHIYLCLTTWLLSLLVCAGGLTACGSDDDDDYSGSTASTSESLIGRRFLKTESGYGDWGVETKKTEIYFSSSSQCTVHVWGNGVDDDGSYSYNWGTINGIWSLSGNTVTVVFSPSHGTETLYINYRNGKLEGYTEQ